MWEKMYQTNAIAVMFTSDKVDREQKTTRNKEDYPIKYNFKSSRKI